MLISVGTGRFAALRRAQSAPNAVGTGPGEDLVGGQIARVDRVGNETYRAVEHSDVNAAGMVALRAAGDPRGAVVPNTGRGVRRKVAGESCARSAAVRPLCSAPRIGRSIDNSRTVRAGRVKQAVSDVCRSAMPGRRNLTDDGEAAFDVLFKVVAGAAFGNGNCIARSVNRERKIAPLLDTEHTARGRSVAVAAVPLVEVAASSRRVADAEDDIRLAHRRVRGGVFIIHAGGFAVGRADVRRNFDLIIPVGAAPGSGPVRVGRTRIYDLRVGIEQRIERVLFNKGQKKDLNARREAVVRPCETVVVVGGCERRTRPVDIVVILYRQNDLLDVVGALHTARGLARRLYRWEKESNQYSDDCDDDKKFHEGESASFRAQTTSRVTNHFLLL